MIPHPRGPAARVLLSSVFKPFARDDDYGSRAINPMELYHNQVTRAQGPCSLRMFHRSWGLMFIQENVSAATTLLDFPTRERFIRELRRGRYDVVGLSGIVVNVGKIREMCRLVRRYSPASAIVVGGHVTAIPDIERLIDADHIVRGEGIAWMRRFLGDDPDRPIVHPAIRSSVGFRVLGLRSPRGGGSPAATIVPSVGCPLGCEFCTTSAFFGGKGRFVNFYERGEDLFRVMCDVERRLGVRAFFMMDENFLLYRRRALELLACMKAAGKAWALYVFSSANAIRRYDVRELVELGVEWIWLGLESSEAPYEKLSGTDTRALVRDLQAHGICVHGSTIVGLEHHTPESVMTDIDRAVAHDTVFHQFMLFTPIPGTPLHARMAAEGRLLDVDLADVHGQYQFNFRHPAIGRDESKRVLDHAFQVDFDRNGPSLYRLMRTMFVRWRRYADDPDARVRARVAVSAASLRLGYGAALWAMARWLAPANPVMARRIDALAHDVEEAFGPTTRLVNRTLGPVLLWSARREARHAGGRHLEPPTFVDRRPRRDAAVRFEAPEAAGVPVLLR
ncbi:MAG: cobalamin-dependent protein [Vicinamibacterales bacterium]